MNLEDLADAACVIALCDRGEAGQDLLDIGYALSAGLPVIWISATDQKRHLADVHVRVTRLHAPISPEQLIAAALEAISAWTENPIAQTRA